MTSARVNKLFTIALVSGFIIISGSSHGQYYRNSAGIKFVWGLGGTIKHFVHNEAALEGVVNYRRYSEADVHWNHIRLMGLYEIHDNLDEVFAGLAWYYGVGGFIGFWGGNYIDMIKGDKTNFGITGAVGLDYAFLREPINISLDWTPMISLVGGGGFRGEAGGLALRYIF